MAEIVYKRILAEKIVEIEVVAPTIAKKRKAGQFIILRIHEQGERIPLTIADSDAEKGTITLIFQEVGKTTEHLAMLEVGDSLLDLVGPLGRPTHIEDFGTVCCVGGGIGIAPVHPVAKAMREGGNKVIGIIGARTEDLLIMCNRMKAATDQLHICTDDGSFGFYGFVSDMLEKLINDGVKIDLCMAVGPVPMMRATCALTEKYKLPTVVSLNPIMVDGTGMCGACRLSVGGVTKFVCVDGPEFDGHQVDWKEMTMRQSAYLPQEKESLEHFHAKRHCLEEVTNGG